MEFIDLALREGDDPAAREAMGALYLKDLADKTRRGLRGRVRGTADGGAAMCTS
jgi:hypothetical protein